MKKLFNSNSACISLSGSGLVTFTLAVMAGACALLNANLVRAQQPVPQVSVDVAQKVSKRAEKFMRDIAALSPIPQSKDTVHAQAWPRPLDNELSAEERTVAVHPAITLFTSAEDVKNGLSSRVRLQGRTGVELVINSKETIASFFDWQLMHTLEREPPVDEEQFISPATAAARSLKYMGAMGIDTNEYVLHTVQYFSNTDPASARSQAWYVDFDRVWQGVPYLNHSVSINLDAAQGRLMTGGGQCLAVQPPVEGRLDVSAAQALAIAQRAMAPQVVEIAGDADVELRVVLPSHFWSSAGRDYSPSSAQSRLAWRVRQPAIMQRNIERTLELWIDTLTGEILGGDNVGLKGPGKIGLPGGSIGKTLREARQLQALPVASPTAHPANKQIGSNVLSLDLNTNNLRFYGLLAGITGPIPPAVNQKPIAFKATHRLTATLADGKKLAYLYDASNGRITTADGVLGEIVQAGAVLRAWLAPAALISSKTKQTAR